MKGLLVAFNDVLTFDPALAVHIPSRKVSGYAPSPGKHLAPERILRESKEPPLHHLRIRSPYSAELSHVILKKRFSISMWSRYPRSFTAGPQLELLGAAVAVQSKRYWSFRMNSVIAPRLTPSKDFRMLLIADAPRKVPPVEMMELFVVRDVDSGVNDSG